MRSCRPAMVIVLAMFGSAVAAAEFDVGRLAETIKRVDKHGLGHREAVAAIGELQQVDGAKLLDVLQGMDGAGPLAANWLRGAFETIAERELKQGHKLPIHQLEAFVLDRTHGDQSRRLAYEWLTRVDSAAPDRLLPMMLDDPSLELRYDAIARRLGEIELDDKNGIASETIVARYRNVLGAARDLAQIKLIAEKLKANGEEIDLARHFGFVMRWKLIGPFDNSDGQGFTAIYAPEKAIDFRDMLDGKTGPVTWHDFTTNDQYGVVDLNRALGKQMGAVAYAAADFETDQVRPVELRLGCINACKLWLNGELLLEREVYHTGMEIDQYVGQGKLKRGRNLILVKICQNEQTEDWAQNWQFQLRVCDSRGTPVALGRPADKDAQGNQSKE